MKGYFKYTTQLISSKEGWGGVGGAFRRSVPLPAHSILRLRIETAVYIRYVGGDGERREEKKKVSSAAAVANA